jgi:protein associated with RNAse G/E
MGTRDIYIALLVTVCFIVLVDYLLNEESPFCCLPEAFTQYHLDLDSKVTEEEVKKAKEVLERAKQQPQ